MRTQNIDDKTPVIIMAMHDTFLYLPLYFAEKCDFFGYVDDRYEIKVKNPTPRTDRQTFLELVSDKNADQRNVMFAVCDPSTIQEHNPNDKNIPIVLAELICNVAFWAVDRGTQIDSTSDIAKNFDKIISYEKGTTSYGIASRIYREAGRDPKKSILPVRPKQEYPALEGCTEKSIMISPDILGIQHFVNNDENEENFSIDYGLSREFGGIFLTGLLSRLNILSEQPGLVEGILKALQKSMNIIHDWRSHPELIDFATKRFGARTKEFAQDALKAALASHVFPLSIEPIEADWRAIIKLSYESHGRPIKDADAFAISSWNSSIHPFTSKARDAVHSLRMDLKSSHIKSPQVPHGMERMPTPLIAHTIMTVGFAVASLYYLGIRHIVPVLIINVAIIIADYYIRAKDARYSQYWLCAAQLVVFCLYFSIIFWSKTGLKASDAQASINLIIPVVISVILSFITTITPYLINVIKERRK